MVIAHALSDGKSARVHLINYGGRDIEGLRVRIRGRFQDGVAYVPGTGKVTNPRVEKSTHPSFEKPALESVRKWKFEPAVRSGQRVPCKMRIPIRFQPS